MTSTPISILNKIQDAKSSKKLDLSTKPLYGEKNKLDVIPPEVFNLTDLEVLKLSFNNIKKVPSEIRKLKNLTTLDLSFNSISDIPKEFSHLNKLHTLDLGYIDTIKDYSIVTKLTGLRSLNICISDYKDQIYPMPVEILKLSSLESLDISGRDIQKITEQHIDLNSLKSLGIRNCELKELPSWLNKLPNLEKLNVTDNQISIISEIIKSLGSLVSLLISDNLLKTLPDWLVQLPHFRELDISGNKDIEIPKWLPSLNLDSIGVSDLNLKHIPKAVLLLNKLKKISLSQNRISFIEDEISELKNLTSVNFALNPIKSLKPILKLSELKSLVIGGCQLANLPKDIELLKNLTRLWAISNRLKTLPETFGNLKNLKMLGLANNLLENIPECVFEIESLEELYLENDDFGSKENENQIKTISPSILKLQNLREFTVSGNPIESPPQEIVENGIDAIKNYYRQLEVDGRDYLYEAKLLILGEGGAGKTTLAKKITDPKYPLQDSEKSTEGIDISHWHFLTERENKFQVNIWDFGGQEIYHTTHQFFLTKRSLYMLVADTRKEDTDFYYWLNVVELLSDNSPVIIIKNEKQDRHREISEFQLRGQFTNLKEILATNLATNRGLEGVLTDIKHYIGQLPHIGTPLPKTWVKIRETLERDERTYIAFSEFLNICNDNGFVNQKDQLQLIGFLHDLGICLHFQDDPILQRIVILKPKWGTDAVYKVLDNKDLIRNLGHFTRSDLAKIWNEPEYVGMNAELLQLMMKFKLCYMVPSSDGVYIAPQLLTENQPPYD